VTPTSGEFELASGRSLFELEADRVGWLAKASRELWRHLPAWMFFLIGLCALHGELAMQGPSRPDLAPTVLFPLTGFCLYYVARALWAPDVLHRRGMLVLMVGLAFGMPTLDVTYHPVTPLGAEQLRRCWEVATVLTAVVLAVHAWRRHRTAAYLCFGVGLAYGAVVETCGILLGFLKPHPGSWASPLAAPWVMLCGWTVALYMSFFVVRALRGWVPSLRKAPRTSAILLTGVAVLLLLQVDPAATAVGQWAWAPGLPTSSHGVPFAGLVAWAAALLPLAYYIYRFQQHAGLTDRSRWTAGQLRLALESVPAMLTVAAAFFLVTVGLSEGTKGPSYDLIYGAVERLLAWL
jgi:hypothetical protein